MSDAIPNPLDVWLDVDGNVFHVAAGLARIAEVRRGATTERMDAFLEQPDPETAFEAAQSLDTTDLDEKRCWIWIAATMGDLMAASDLLGHLEVERACGTGETDPRIEKAYMHWTSKLMLSMKGETAGISSDPTSRAGSGLPDVRGSIVVVPSVGAAQSREGAGLMQQHGHRIGVALPHSGFLPERGEVLRSIRTGWPWASEAALEFESAFSVLRQAPDPTGPRLPPILLVGEAGTGKSSLARHVAAMAGMHGVVLPLGGVQDGAGLSETTRGYSTTRPSIVAETMLQEGICNPLFVLDEIDKSVSGQNGNVHATLLSLVGAPDYFDRCLLSRVDVSRTSFVATANTTDTIPVPLLDRFVVVHVDRPLPEHLSVLEASARKDFAMRHGYVEAALPMLSASARTLLRRVLAAKGSARAFAQAHDRILKSMLMEFETTHAPGLLN